MIDRCGTAPERMFTFTTSSARPRKRVRCHNCGWTATGNDERTFKKADAHTCRALDEREGAHER